MRSKLANWAVKASGLRYTSMRTISALSRGERPGPEIITEEDSMTKKLPKRGLPPMHPGELLREEILPALARPKTEIARLLGVSRQTLYDLLEERQPVTPTMALRLGKLCGNGPDLWLNLQKRYDLQRAAQELGEKLDAIPTLEVA